jgi:hypothetical protein
VVVTITPENPGAGEDYTMVTSYDLDEEVRAFVHVGGEVPQLNRSHSHLLLRPITLQVTSGTATYVATLNGKPFYCMRAFVLTVLSLVVCDTVC